MKSIASSLSGLSAALILCATAVFAQSKAPAPAPVIVVETTKGTFEIETYPADAPKTIAHIVALVASGFYDGQRVHRALPGVLVQWGDPRSRDLQQAAEWGRGPDASSGQPIGAVEIT